jgi:hypothetical protein
MPDNPFENKARQKLDELKFVPSDAVWQKVEAQIKKDRDRRRRLVWLPLFCLFLAAGGWYLIAGKSTLLPAKEPIALAEQHQNNMDSSADRHGISKVGSSVSPGKNKDEGTNESGNRTADRSITPRINGTISSSKEHGKIRRVPEQSRADGNGYALNSPSGKKDWQEANLSDSKADLPGDQKELLHPAEKQDAGKNAEPVTEEKKPSGLSTETPDAISSGSAKSADSADSYTASGKKPDSPDQKKLFSSGPENKDSLKSIAGKTTSGKKAKLQWGFTGGTGLSSAYRKFTDDNYTSAIPSSANPPATSPSLPSTRPAISWEAGLQLEKKVSKTLSLFSGLHYTSSGIKIAKGRQVNQPLTIYAANYYLSSVSNYYQAAAGSSYDYTSHFHFLEIPMGIEKQLGEHSRFSVNAGISFAWLFSTDALQYNPQSNIYFRDNSYFRKTQWNILGGVQYSLLRKEKYALKIGPQMQYGLTSLLNKKSPYSEHLFSGGIQLLLISNRK